MGNISKNKIIRFIEPNIQQFHIRRLENLLALQLKKILSRKNPYLFKAKNQNTAHDLVKTILDAHLIQQVIPADGENATADFGRWTG